MMKLYSCLLVFVAFINVNKHMSNKILEHYFFSINCANELCKTEVMDASPNAVFRIQINFVVVFTGT